MRDMATDDAGSRKQKFDRNAIRKLAEYLAFLSGEMNGLAKSLEDEQFLGELEIDGGKGLYAALGAVADYHAKLIGARSAYKAPTPFLKNGAATKPEKKTPTAKK